jgi:hypothetical protein
MVAEPFGKSMWKHAFLICNQIGRRHLQSLVLLETRTEIYLLSPSVQLLAIAELRFSPVFF